MKDTKRCTATHMTTRLEPVRSSRGDDYFSTSSPREVLAIERCVRPRFHDDDEHVDRNRERWS